MNLTDIFPGQKLFCKDHDSPHYHMGGTVTSTRSYYGRMLSFIITLDDGTVNDFAWYEYYKFSELP